MKITRLKLINFIGISHGLNKNEIEIDFSKSNNKMVMLLGRNGSGKSTIMSQLHPYKDSFDDRKTLILDGTEGRKEIDYIHNGHTYEIIHIYGKSAQSFIKEDGIELNENGGVRTFEDIVSKKLGITKDYFNIGKIGSNTSSFIDFTTTERKNYIGNFLNIEDILEKHKIAAEKLKLLKKSIQQVANDLGKYKDVEVIKTEIETLSKSNEEIDNELSKLYQEQGSLTTQIQRDNTDIGSASVDDLLMKITEKKADMDTNKDIKATLENELTHIEDANEYKETLAQECASIQTKIQVNNSNKENKMLLITDFNNRLASTKIELSALGNPEDLVKITNEIEKLTEEINQIKVKITSNPRSAFVHKIMSEKKDILRFISKFVDFADFIEKYFTDLSQSSITNTKTNIEYFFEVDFEESFKRQIIEARKAIESKQNLLASQQKERGILEGYVAQLKNLDKRPSTCKNDLCPFIREAYEHRNVLVEIEEKDREITQTKKDIETLTIKAENLQTLNNLYKSFLIAYNSVLPRENDVYTEFIKEKSLIERVKGSVSSFQSERQTFVDELNDATSDINLFLDCNKRLIALNNNKKILQDSDSTLRESKEKDIKEFEAKLETLNSELTTLNEEGTKLASELKEKQGLSEKYNTFLQAASKYASAATMLSTAKTEYERVSKLIENKSTAVARLETVSNRINYLVNLKSDKAHKLTDLKTSLKIVEDLNEKKQKLDADYKPISAIEEALSPTKGIPLILMKTYLDETEAIANELLDIAFDGDFQIKFITSDKEFAIQVNSKGNTKPDIKMASQGEIAITTISLSLALIEQSIGEYNILCLDEIDGPLDTYNRTNFIDILNSQISKLGIEQIFIISHNNAFDVAPMDLVILKGGEVDKNNKVFMDNKTILYEYEE